MKSGPCEAASGFFLNTMTHSPQPSYEAEPTGIEPEPGAGGAMWVNRRFRERLRSAGLAGFDEVMAHRDGRCLRRLRIRENWYLPCTEGQPPSSGLYLKKHRVRTWLSRLRAWLGIGPGESAARVEVKNVTCLAAEGILMMRVVAYGEKLHTDGLLESFLLTEELQGYTDLRQFLRRRFRANESGGTTARDRDLDRLIRQVAEVTRRFHNAGYNHRDLYCCHLFVKEPARGRFDIRMIDLQRVQRRRWFRRRWLVKDLAQLAWSLPRDLLKCKHRLAFVRHYLGVRKLGPAEKRLIRSILRKQCLMEWKLGKAP